MPSAREAFRIAQRFDRELATAENATIARVNQILLNSYTNLDRTLRLQWETLQQNTSIIAAQRQLMIADQLGYLLELINPSQQSTIEQWYKELLNGASINGLDAADELLGDVAPFSYVPVEAIAYSAQESYRRLLTHGSDFANKATVAIGEGLAQGWGIQRVTKILREQLGVAKWKAEQLARTESIKAYSAASQQRYSAAGVDEVIWVTVRQGVCKFCTWRNGKAFKLGTFIHPPHPGCRCTLIPVVGDIADYDFWLDYSEQIEGARDSGLAPFEKSAGMVVVPKPTWAPKRKDG